MVNCPRCNSNIERNWEFCPKCGVRMIRERKDFFSSIFEKMNREIRQMNKQVERDIEAVDISPWFKKPKGRGFSIKIHSGTGMQPKIEVHGFGGVNEENLRKQVQNQLGLKKKAGVFEEKPKIKIAAPKTTEEPKTNIKRANGKVTVDLDIPGLKEDKTEIKELGNSVEVKAIVGDKAYFKILTKPANTKITNKIFEKNILHLELS